MEGLIALQVLQKFNLSPFVTITANNVLNRFKGSGVEFSNSSQSGENPPSQMLPNKRPTDVPRAKRENQKAVQLVQTAKRNVAASIMANRAPPFFLVIVSEDLPESKHPRTLLLLSTLGSGLSNRSYSFWFC